MSFAAISDYGEQKRLIAPILESEGKCLPAEGTAIYFVEFDDDGNVSGFQGVQNALFFEGMYSRDRHTHFRSIWKMAERWIRENTGGGQIFTMAADDRIARAAQTMGCELLPWKVLRRAV